LSNRVSASLLVEHVWVTTWGFTHSV